MAAPLNTPESRFRHSTRSLGTSFHDKAFSGFARSAFNARERKRIRLLVMRKWQIWPVVSKIMINMFLFYRNFCYRYSPIVYIIRYKCNVFSNFIIPWYFHKFFNGNSRSNLRWNMFVHCTFHFRYLVKY